MNKTTNLMKIGLTTLGCKVNQCDSAALTALLEDAGFIVTPFNTFADAYIVNTCTVTGFADFQARQLIRRALRTNPDARIIVTGCYAQTQPQALAAIDGVTWIVGNDQKHTIIELLSHPPTHTQKIFSDDIFRQQEFLSAPARRLANRTRAFFKIQDGCNAFCSYCIVPYARGKSRSLPLEQTLSGIDRFVEQGYREIVLTGIHLGQYGYDLAPTTQLVPMLERILSRHPALRIRLSSIEPTEISDDLLGLFNTYKHLCPHLHIPLQSGDDGVLGMMKRTYDAAFYRSLILRVSKAVPDIAIGIDVMTGFPGEGEAAFRNTFTLLTDLPAAYLHVFPYSERPGTAAISIIPKVPEKIKKERAAILRALSAEKREAYSRSFLGKILPVLVELSRDKKTGLAKGFSHNYLPVMLDKHPSFLVNTIVNVSIDNYQEGKLTGRVIHE